MCRLAVQATQGQYTILCNTKAMWAEHAAQCSLCIKEDEKKTISVWKILLGNTLQAPSRKCSSPYSLRRVYSTHVNLSHRLRACHMCFLTAPQSLLQPPGLRPTAGLEARDVQCAGTGKDQYPSPLHPWLFWLLCILSLLNNTIIWRALTEVKQPHTAAAQLAKRRAGFWVNTN